MRFWSKALHHVFPINFSTLEDCDSGFKYGFTSTGRFPVPHAFFMSESQIKVLPLCAPNRTTQWSLIQNEYPWTLSSRSHSITVEALVLLLGKQTGGVRELAHHFTLLGNQIQVVSLAREVLEQMSYRTPSIITIVLAFDIAFHTVEKVSAHF